MNERDDESKQDEFERFSPGKQEEREHFGVDVPPTSSMPSSRERMPSPYEPMGEIELRGRAYRGLAKGGQPWWVLIAGWFLFGFIFLFVLAAILPALLSDFHPIVWLFGLLGLIIAALPLIATCRGTVAKLSRRNGRRR